MPTSKSAAARRQRRRKATKSPYFAKTKTLSSPKESYERVTSPYFDASPSSAFGAVRSLGPLLLTMTSVPSLCLRDVETRNEEKELETLEAAARQFSHCQTFNMMLRDVKGDSRMQDRVVDVGSVAHSKETDYNVDDQEAEFFINHSVRHLCEHKCYLRAFAPARDWHALRTRVDERAECSADLLLKGWTCCLVPPCSCKTQTSNRNEANSMDYRQTTRKEHQQCSQVAAPILQTVFVEPNGKLHKSISQVLRRLGLEGNSSVAKKRQKPSHSEVQNTPKRLRGSSVCCPDGSSPVSVVETEIVPWNWPYGRRCMEENDEKVRLDCNASRRRTYRSCSVSTPLGLLEEMFASNPWRLLLSTIMLNRTSRLQVDAVLYRFLQRWPDAYSAANADAKEISAVIEPLGLYHKRSAAIVRFSKEYLDLVESKMVGKDEPVNSQERSLICECFRMRTCKEFRLAKEEILGLYNCGNYAADAYEIFIRGVFPPLPADHALRSYVEFQRGLMRWKVKGDAQNKSRGKKRKNRSGENKTNS